MGCIYRCPGFYLKLLDQDYVLPYSTSTVSISCNVALPLSLILDHFFFFLSYTSHSHIIIFYYTIMGKYDIVYVLSMRYLRSRTWRAKHHSWLPESYIVSGTNLVHI